MAGLTKEQYDKQRADCDGLCEVPHDKLPADPQQDGLMRCVTCPFCKQVVDAVITPTTISCPACHVSVSR